MGPDATPGDRYEPGRAQHLEVVGDGGLADIEAIDDIASTDRLLLGDDEPEERVAGFVGERLEHPQRPLRLVARHRVHPDRRHTAGFVLGKVCESFHASSVGYILMNVNMFSE